MCAPHSQPGCGSIGGARQLRAALDAQLQDLDAATLDADLDAVVADGDDFSGATGKITRAAEKTGVSYRHAWNLVEKWSLFFETPLVERRQGRGTTLTPFGEKLVWAGQRLQARLGPQLQNLAQELATDINQLLPQANSTVRVHASHGFAVSKLRDLLAREPGLSVDFRYVGNPNSLTSLATGHWQLRPCRHAPAAGRAAQKVHRCLSGTMVPRAAPHDWLRDARDRIDGEPRPGFRHPGPVRATAEPSGDRRCADQRLPANDPGQVKTVREVFRSSP
ncbi:MAG TPA: LysR family transcriptional regulator [Steroidobacteraceae bacterium]|jgi:molybdate transport repressor ModE-like protein